MQVVLIIIVLFIAAAAISALIESIPIYVWIVLAVIVAAVAALAIFLAVRRKRKLKAEAEAKRLEEEEKEQAEWLAARAVAEAERMQAKSRTEAKRLEDDKKAAEEEQRQRMIEQKIAAMREEFLSGIAALPEYEIRIDPKPAKKGSVSDSYAVPFTSITSKTKLEKLGDFVGIDVETTGLNPSHAEIVSVVAIRFRNFQPVEKFETLCRPKNGIKPEAQRINKITEEMVDGKPLFGQVVRSLEEFIGNENIVAHNLEFDLAFIVKHGFELGESKRKYYDTLTIAQKTIKKQRSKWDKEMQAMMPVYDCDSIENHKLPTLCSWYGIPYFDAHSAAADCYVLGDLLRHLAEEKTGALSRN